MRFARQTSTYRLFPAIAALLATAVLAGCGKDNSSVGQSPSTSFQQPAGINVMRVTVNGALCGDPAHQYANEPCVSVTLCSPVNHSCQTIGNILLDTGSYGLRLFKSVITVPLQPVTVAGGKSLAECVQFGDGSSEWGQVEYADVQLGSESPVHVPIQVVDASYASPPGPCTSAQSRPDMSPAQTGFNGILGVGLFASDCGSTCATSAANGQYYACSSTSCSGAAAAESIQVRNPVSLLPQDNNGVILRLPAVPSDGAAELEGTLILGIGTQSNNQPGALKTFTADANGDFTTTFSGYSSKAITGFIDSGSSVLFFPPPSSGQLPDCNSAAGGSHGAGYAGFYCPASTLGFTAQNTSATTSTKASTPFNVGNAYLLFQSGHMVFSTMADSSAVGSTAVFDWGLPFFFGRDVYVGIDTTTSALGTGPYWAY